jgi:hypothetical protein
MITSDELLYLNKINAKNFTYRVCNDKLFTINNGILFQKNSYLIDAFDLAISHLQSNGLLNYWIKKYIDSNYYNVKDAKDARMPEKLTLSQLLGSFQMWFCGMIIASIAFMLEIIYFKIQIIFWARRNGTRGAIKQMRRRRKSI